MMPTSPEARPGDAVGGVRDPRRLQAVAQAELAGHLGDPALNAIVASLRIACRVPIAVVNVVTEDLQTYPAEVGVGAPCTTVPDELSFCAEVVDTRGPVLVVDAVKHPTYSHNPLVLDGVVGSYAGFPLIDDGHVLGSVSIFDSEARVFTMDELALLGHQARAASAVLALRRSARSDPLTGLPNRRSLLDRLDVALARAERHGGDVAVLHLELDGSGPATVQEPQAADDTLVETLARRWREALRLSDTLARVAGHQFVVVCEDVAGPAQADGIAERLAEAAREVGGTREQAGDVVVRVGVVVVHGTGRDPADVLREAEVAARRVAAAPGSRAVGA